MTGGKAGNGSSAGAAPPETMTLEAAAAGAAINDEAAETSLGILSFEGVDEFCQSYLS